MRYGAALNVTERKAEARAQSSVREPLDALTAALRSYVLRVTNYLDEGEGDEGEGVDEPEVPLGV